jgi:hypothetical protein
VPIRRLIDKLFGGESEPAARVPAKSASHQWISNPWHAVSVIPCRGACVVARESNRVRFLSKDAPKLPLRGCPLRACECRYRHHEDRRGNLRRASDVMSANRSWPGQERRSSLGRRATDGL